MKKYKRILVTGPQRSGTTICAKMIAEDTGFRYIDGIRMSRLTDQDAEKHFKEGFQIVLQAAYLSNICTRFAGSDTLIVFMLRNTEDIIASEERIKWKGEVSERKRYQGFIDAVPEWKDRPISHIKYLVWQRQKKRIPNHVELKYESLKEHKLWIAKAQRTNFQPKQTNL